MNMLLSAQSAQGGDPTQSIMLIGVWIVVMVAMFWFMNSSQRKEQKKLATMLSNLEIGDSIMTTGGFYGMVIDINDDTVIVEFGNNKNCRIPMNKTSIAQVEKPGAE
ncbi:MAG: preprotein translocase subunit YajC [Lachnospiraceae bacterium]|nr:preprotein translocase subunit YajC [Lachnospiraceae bacterium]